MTTVLPSNAPSPITSESRTPPKRSHPNWMTIAVTFVVGAVVGASATVLVVGTGWVQTTPAVVAPAQPGLAPAAIAPAAPAVPEAPAVTAAAVVPAPVNQVGQTFHNLGATVTVTGARISDRIDLNESSYRPGSGYERYTSTRAGDGAKFVVIQTRVVNDSTTSFDLTCSLPISTRLVDTRGRMFDSIDDLYKIKGNPECNNNLQPGFASTMTWAYRVPSDATVAGWSFEDATNMSTIGVNQPTYVALQPSR